MTREQFLDEIYKEFIDKIPKITASAEHPLALMAQVDLETHGAQTKIADRVGLTRAAIGKIVGSELHTNICVYSKILGYKLARTGDLSFAFVRMTNAEHVSFLDELESRPKRKRVPRAIRGNNPFHAIDSTEPAPARTTDPDTTTPKKD